MRTIVDLEGIIEKIQSKAADVEIVWESEAWRELSSSGTSHPHPQRISVLDSSFNPPTLAHLSLALQVPPPPPAAYSKEDISPPSNHIAHLLLLSVRNVDKKLKPGDASFAQRLQMIILLAKEMEARLSATSMRPLAVAAIDEPTFVGKSKKLLEYFRGKYPNVITVAQLPRLTFVLGYDTIIRFFNPKYYDGHDGMVASLNTFFHQDRSSILCAQRPTEGPGLGLESTTPAGSSSSATDEEIAFLQSSDVEPYVRSGAVSMFSIDSTESALRSTLVRQSVSLTEAPSAFEDTTTPADLRPRDWRSMVPPTVAAYIVRNSLYVRK